MKTLKFGLLLGAILLLMGTRASADAIRFDSHQESRAISFASQPEKGHGVQADFINAKPFYVQFDGTSTEGSGHTELGRGAFFHRNLRFEHGTGNIGTDVVVTPAAEPSSLLLAGLGLAALALLRKQIA